jgi:hypothetical protein
MMRRFREWVEGKVAARRTALAHRDRNRWLSTFDEAGRYRHWSGYWESITGYVWVDGRGWVLLDEAGYGCGYVRRVTGEPIVNDVTLNVKK